MLDDSLLPEQDFKKINLDSDNNGGYVISSNQFSLKKPIHDKFAQTLEKLDKTFSQNPESNTPFAEALAKYRKALIDTQAIYRKLQETEIGLPPQ